MSQIRITKTPELEKVLEILKTKWSLMDEVEIVKMAINTFYQEQSLNQNVEFLTEEESKGIETSLKQIKAGKTTKYESKKFLKEVME